MQNPIQQIIQEICNDYGVSLEELTGPGRDRFMAKARKEVYTRLKNELDLSYQKIANILGRKSHTTPLRLAKKKPMEDRMDPNPLSGGKIEVLRLVAEGLSNKEIGQRLFLSETTVKRSLSEIFDKLGISDRAGAVAIAIRKGWI